MEHLKALIRDVPDFPMPGILFRDVTPLLRDPGGLRQVVDALAARYRGQEIDVVAGIESRGFIFGAPLAVALGCGFVPVRKLGKLPRRTASSQSGRGRRPWSLPRALVNTSASNPAASICNTRA